MCSFQIIEPSPLHDIVQPFGPSPPLGNAIKLSGRTSWLPIGGAARRAEGAALRYIQHCSMTAGMPLLPSALPPKGEARRYVANDFLNLIALPFGGDAEGRGGVFPRPLGRFYGFLNDYGIPLAFKKPYNLASLVEMHPLWCLRHHLSPGGGTGPMDLSLSDKAIFKNTSQENLHHVLLSDHRTFAIA